MLFLGNSCVPEILFCVRDSRIVNIGYTRSSELKAFVFEIEYICVHRIFPVKTQLKCISKETKTKNEFSKVFTDL